MSLETHKKMMFFLVGQCNDGYFRLSFQGHLKCLVDKVESLSKKHVHLESGKRLECDVLVIASGMKHNLSPPFLERLGLGFQDLHNHAFLGRNPRIGCASDFVFAYVPYGPLKQMDMFFHSIKCCMKGMEKVCNFDKGIVLPVRFEPHLTPPLVLYLYLKEMRDVLRPTPLPNYGGGSEHANEERLGYTFFEYSHWWSMESKALHDRIVSMLSTLDVGKTAWERVGMRMKFLAENIKEWFLCVGRSAKEISRFPVFGPDVTRDHFEPVLTEKKSSVAEKDVVTVKCYADNP